MAHVLRVTKNRSQVSSHGALRMPATGLGEGTPSASQELMGRHMEELAATCTCIHVRKGTHHGHLDMQNYSAPISGSNAVLTKNPRKKIEKQDSISSQATMFSVCKEHTTSLNITLLLCCNHHIQRDDNMNFQDLQSKK